MMRGALFFLVTGIIFIILGSAELLPRFSSDPLGFVVVMVSVSLAGIVVSRRIREFTHDKRLNKSMRGVSREAAQWIPMLYGNYTPYIIEAAERLGAARETTAVPALVHVLEQTVNTQPPDWCDTSEALVVALGQMGDRRALPLLNRLLDVRGIGLLTAVHEAIDRIEPASSLLRPGSADNLSMETLLRPAESGVESDPALLLRGSQQSRS